MEDSNPFHTERNIHKYKIIKKNLCFSQTAVYLRTHVTFFKAMVQTHSVSVNSRTMAASASPFCVCVNLLPSNVKTVFTLRPSMVSSTNSSSNLNVSTAVLTADWVVKVYVPSSALVRKMVGLADAAILRMIMLTPAGQKIISSKISQLSWYA